MLVLVLATSGCMTSRMAANRIVEAPNLHDRFGVNRATKVLWEHLETNFVVPGTTHPIISLTVPVGPPPAVLKAILLPPQDYHLNISDKVVPGPHGKHNLDFWMMPETNAAPRPEPPDRHATIFVLHGFLMNKETMAGWAFFLAQAGYRVVLVDLRGHGQSTGDTVSFGQHGDGGFRRNI